MLNAGNSSGQAVQPAAVGRSDYTANAGDVCDSIYCFSVPQGYNYNRLAAWPSAYPNDDAGPASFEDGGVFGTQQPNAGQLVNARTSFQRMATWMTGIVYRGSMIRVSDISDGTSSTYLLGEKKLDPDCYTAGGDGGDNEAALVGDDNDTQRWTGYVAGKPNAPWPCGPNKTCDPPQVDTPGYSDQWGFGAAHLNGFMMALCDGSVHLFSYSMDPEIHRRLSNREDGLTIDAKSF
jgi:hypothetical protein